MFTITIQNFIYPPITEYLDYEDDWHIIFSLPKDFYVLKWLENKNQSSELFKSFTFSKTTNFLNTFLFTMEQSLIYNHFKKLFYSSWTTIKIYSSCCWRALSLLWISQHADALTYGQKHVRYSWTYFSFGTD